MKKPRLDRGPKLSSAIAQPQTMITSGVRQVLAAGNRRRSPSATAMQFLDGWGGSQMRLRRAQGAKRPANRRRAKLMHPHGNPNRDLGQTSPRNAAMQIGTGSFDELTRRVA